MMSGEWSENLLMLIIGYLLTCFMFCSHGSRLGLKCSKYSFNSTFQVVPCNLLGDGLHWGVGKNCISAAAVCAPSLLVASCQRQEKGTR